MEEILQKSLPRLTLMNRNHSLIPASLAALGLAVSLAGCGGDQSPSATTPPPPEVSVVRVASERVERTTELPGRITPMREAQVRARATGILQRRLFEEGSNVEEGQVLFEIDPAPLQARLDSAQASLARAEAALTESKATIARYRELVEIDAISKQLFDQAVATLGQNEAEWLSAKASVQTAALNLGYARVTAPISGRIGKALVTEGALVSADEATQLAVIRQLDPVYFDFTQSSTDVLRLKRALEEGALETLAPGEARMTLILEDGFIYRHAGKMLFSDISVDAATGTITLRAEFPNPENLLLPGMFARAQIIEGYRTNALTIPQRTVTRGVAGAASVLVVNDENTVESRTIEVAGSVGTKVVVTKGLAAGERVVVEGLQKARPGSAVAPVPFQPLNVTETEEPTEAD